MSVIIETYEELLERAILIVSAPQFSMILDQERFARLEVSGEKATIRWPELADGYYNSSSIEEQKIDFSSSLLLMSMDEIKIWLDTEKKKYDDDMKVRRLAVAMQSAAEKEAFDKATYERLKKKYGEK